MSSSNLVRWGALGAMLAGLAWIVLGIVTLGTTEQGFPVGAIHAIALVGTLGGILGLDARQTRSYGRLGAAGFVAALAGGAVTFVNLVLAFLVSSSMGGLAQLLGLLVLGTGLVLLGVATLRARVLPRWCGVALIASPALGVLGAYGGSIVLGLVWLALGYVLWSGRLPILPRWGGAEWWLLPPGILAASALIALSIVVFGPSFTGGRCSGAWATDYACYQERYQDLVGASGVETAFAELKGEYKENRFVQSNCHQLTHVIGRAGAERYGSIPSAYARGDDFCGSGYYHGAMEAVVAKVGPDKILEEAATICADPSEGQNHSAYHRNCVHGLGHGFMAAQENELFESLQTCDALTDGWEREHCYGGVFMQNVMAKDDPSHPSKYLKADQPLYPCTDVETKYKNICYKRQTPYLLSTQGDDFAKVFDLCATEVEAGFQTACYQGLGWDAAIGSINGEGITRVDKNKATSTRCMLGEDYGARPNCVVGAVKLYIQFYNSDTQAKALCESFDADLRAACLQATEEHYESLQP